MYSKSVCFDPLPFPESTPDLRSTSGSAAESIDGHRKAALKRDERVTITGMYNVVEKLRSGEALTPKERAIHETAARGVLKDLHDELDRLVAEAYGWPWPMEKEEILERLVKLHDERVEEEKRGLIRWLRPDYQVPRFAPEGQANALDLPESETKAPVATAAEKVPWPGTAVEQLGAISGLIARGPVTVDSAIGAFSGADRKLVQRHVETLALMGEASVEGAGNYAKAMRVA